MRSSYKIALSIILLILILAAGSIWYTSSHAKDSYQNLLTQANLKGHSYQLTPVSFDNSLLGAKIVTHLQINKNLLQDKPLQFEIVTQLKYLPFYTRGSR
ncbi:DUF945 family protein [Dongshaea marina]|uniref:DUF945 family protein n=1 Tax=Dongshaea marina TaxID=2047966 RepID=UPI000D3ECCB7|nr:DUF945 family protein [Dongshaea marina]